jgi:hypothetical protein
MNWIYIIALVAVVLTIVQTLRQWLKKRADYALLSERVHNLKSNCYAFLKMPA